MYSQDKINNKKDRIFEEQNKRIMVVKYFHE